MFVKKAIAGYVREILFRLKWLTMSERQRYAYLWSGKSNSRRVMHRLYHVLD